MCGIIGYLGKNRAEEIVLNGLKKLEYRGYDSWGYLVYDGENLFLKKRVGKISEAEKEGKEGFVGVGHCLSPETLVQLADGRIKKIKEIEPDDEILTFDFNNLKLIKSKIKVFRHKSPEYLFKIQTNLGFIETTDIHRMFVFENGEFKEKVVKDLKKGDLLIIPINFITNEEKIKFKSIKLKRYYRLDKKNWLLLKNYLYNNNISKITLANILKVTQSYAEHIFNNDRSIVQSVSLRLKNFYPLIKLFPIKEHSHGKLIKLPKKSSQKVMEFLGYLWGDGYVGKRTVRFKDQELLVLKKYKRLAEEIFNVNGRLVKLNKYNAYLLELNSSGLAQWLKINVLENRDEFLLNLSKLPKKEILSFIKGLFDAEGAIGLTSKQLKIAMTDENLIRILQLILLRFGIIASLRVIHRNNQWKDFYSLTISNYNSIYRFYKLINTNSRLKKRKIEYLLKIMKPGFNFGFKIFPFTKKDIIRYLKIKGVKASAFKDILGNYDNSYLTEFQLQKFAKNFYKKIIPNKWKKLLKNKNLIFVQVKNVKKVKSDYEWVYDLEVEKFQNFLANGFISHNSRWATHGGVTEYNAHPHFDCQRKIFVVHNGIIENYEVLKNLLLKEGHKFSSETDTEVVSHLIEKYLKEGNSYETAIFKTVNTIRGSFALVIFNLDEPEKLVAIRFASPLILGKNKDEFIVASDPLPVKLITNEFIALEEGEIAFIEKDKFTIKSFDNREKIYNFQKIDWDLEEIELGNFPDFMLKEIYESPKAVKNTLRGRIIPEKGEVKLGGLEMIEEKLKGMEKVVLTACGTAYYAGLLGKYLLEELTEIDVDSEIASELRYRNYPFNEKTCLIAISQSGETADTLEAVKEAKKKGALTLGIINVPGSTIARTVDAGIYTYAGPERAVASTKAFYSQITALIIFSIFLGRRRGLSFTKAKEILEELNKIPEKMEGVFDLREKIKKLAESLKNSKSIFYLGRKYSYPVALEGALKIKEIAYIHAEAYPGGEMKHGPLALIEENFPVVFIAPKDSTYQKSLSNIEEVKARGGRIILVTTGEKAKLENDVIYVPQTLEILTPLLTTLPLHLLAYETAKLLNRNIDRPRNLAKSVTVE